MTMCIILSPGVRKKLHLLTAHKQVAREYVLQKKDPDPNTIALLVGIAIQMGKRCYGLDVTCAQDGTTTQDSRNCGSAQFAGPKTISVPVMKYVTIISLFPAKKQFLVNHCHGQGWDLAWLKRMQLL